MLAVSRQGRPFRGRLKNFRFRAGDVLLLEGEADQLPEVIAALGCLPLAERRLQVGTRGHAGVVALLFGGAIDEIVIDSAVTGRIQEQVTALDPCATDTVAICNSIIASPGAAPAIRLRNAELCLDNCTVFGAIIAGPILGRIIDQAGWTSVFWIIVAVYVASSLCWLAIDTSKSLVIVQDK